MSAFRIFLALLLSLLLAGGCTQRRVDDDDDATAGDDDSAGDDDDATPGDDDDATPGDDDDDATPGDDDDATSGDDDDATPGDDDDATSGDDDDATPVDEYEGDEPGECSDGADNDRDGLFDCADPDCAGAPDCSGDDDDDDDDTPVDTFEGDEPGECSDGLDNDLDGRVDCADRDCEGTPECGGDDDDSPGDDDDDATFGDDDDATPTDEVGSFTWSGTLTTGAGSSVSGVLTLSYSDSSEPPLSYCDQTFSHGGTASFGLGLLAGCSVCEGVLEHGPHTETTAGCSVPEAFEIAAGGALFDTLYATRGLVSAGTVRAAGLNFADPVGDDLVDILADVDDTGTVVATHVALSELSLLFGGLSSGDFSSSIHVDSIVYNDGSYVGDDLSGSYGYFMVYQGTFGP